MSAINVNRNCKGIWIPIHIWTYEKLTTNEKVLLSEINSLCSKGECFATNEYFSKFLGIHKTNISKMISNLKKLGFVNVNIVCKENSKEIDKRIIKINTVKYNVDLKEVTKEELKSVLNEIEQNPDPEPTPPPTQKHQPPIDVNTKTPTQKHQPPLDVNTKEINKYINNNINKYIFSSSEKKLETMNFKEKENKKIESVANTLSTKDYQYILKDFFAYMQKDFETNSKTQKDILNILSKGYSIEEVKSTINNLMEDLKNREKPEAITLNYILNPKYFDLNFQKYQSTKKHNSSKPKPSYDLEEFEHYSIFDEIMKKGNSNFIEENYDEQLDPMHQKYNRLDNSDNNEFYDDTENYNLGLAY